MVVDSVQRSVNMLAASLHMRMDYNNLASGNKKLLIVEGQTDEKFIAAHLQEDVICIVANKAFGTSNGFSPKPALNCKNAIIEVVYGLSVIPMLITCPKGSEDWKVFGMVDMDFDAESSYTRTSRLFITDTHDLETLMLSTDSDLLQRIDNCIITPDDAKKAMFMAYQLGKMKQLLIDVDDISLKPISMGKEEVDFSQFINIDGQISVCALIAYINKQTDSPMSSAKEKKLVAKLLKDKSAKKILSPTGVWASTIDSFNIEKVTDIWSVVNGHDILALLKYVNESAAIKFKNSSGYSLNREFEMALIRAYEPLNFRKTRICGKMVAEEIVIKA